LENNTTIFKQCYLELNSEQKLAVDTIEGPVMVLAGPGTGKTQVIAVRIGKILQETQVDPENILCLTFTDSAVNSMRQRLLEIIGKPAHRVKIFTFHSFCNDVIKSNPEQFPLLSFEAEQLTDVEKIQIIKNLISELDTDNPLKPFGNVDLYVKPISGLISSLKREAISPERLKQLSLEQKQFFEQTSQLFLDLLAINARSLKSEQVNNFISALKSLNSDFPLVTLIDQLIIDFDMLNNPVSKMISEFKKQLKKIFVKYSDSKIILKMQALAGIFEIYQKRLQKLSRYDYEDMISYVVSAFDTNEMLLREYQERYQYILVDEFQDTNSAQNQTVTTLGKFFESPNIFVVGDDEQAIYRFQGAALENLIDFFKSFKSEIKLISLQTNYRSHQKILDAARGLIAVNDANLTKFLPDIVKAQIAKSKAKLGALDLIATPDAISEHLFIVKKIKELLKQGVKASEIAIIYREHKDVLDLLELLDSEKITYQAKKSGNILQEPLFYQLTAFINYLVQPDNDSALFGILNANFLGFNGLDLVKIYRFIAKNELALAEVIQDKIKLSQVELANPDKFLEFAEKLANWQKQIHNQNAVTFFNDLIRESGYLHYLLAQKDYYQLLPKLNRFYNEIKHYDRTNEDFTLVDFVKYLEVSKAFKLELNIADSTDIKEDAIQLLTAHSAKGKEFEQIFIINAIDKKWGNKSNRDNLRLPLGIFKTTTLEEENEEERRLFYVALTRAKEHIYLTYSEQSLTGRKQQPSRFISEINKEYLNVQTEIRNPESEISYIEKIFSNTKLINYSQEGKLYIQDLLKDLKLTVTHFNSYRRCPRCFFLNSILRLPNSKNKNSSYGTAVHNALRDFYRKLKKDLVVPEKEFLLNAFTYQLRHQRLDVTEYQEALEHGLSNLTGYYETYKDQFKPNVLLELNFSTQNVVVNDIPLTGKIDRVDFLDSLKQEVAVTDYKTGNPDSKSTALSKNLLGEYYAQLVFYKILIENSADYHWRVKDAIIDFIEKSPKKGEQIRKVYQIDQSDQDKLLVEIKDVYQKIMNMEFEHFDEKVCMTPELHTLDINV